MQDLTREDIRQFVDDRFRSVPQLASMASENEDEMNKVKEQIVHRAEGVFLWVSLAVKDQIQGLRNDDSPEQLQERLTRLPSEIEGVYTRMLDRIDKIYLREASLILKMALFESSLSTLELALASYPDLEDMLSSTDEISVQKMVSLCRSTRNKLVTRCAGILEVHEGPYLEDIDQEDKDQEDEPDKRGSPSRLRSDISDVEILTSEMSTAVDFVHRTAIDFLKNPGPGKAFIDTNISPTFGPQVQYVKALLGGSRLIAELKLRRSEGWFGTSQFDIDNIMGKVADLEDSTRMPQVKLCELIDCTMSNLDRRLPNWSSDSHWCARQGQLTGMKTPGQDAICPHSSQEDVTLSTTSPITNLDNHGAAQTDPRTFLGFAASHGLSLYVNHILDCREKKVGLEELDDLLCCSVFGYRFLIYFTHFDSRPLILVPELLSRGANRNARLEGKTIWETFLGRMASTWEFLATYRSPTNLEILALATIAFIEHGADLGTIWSGTFNFTWFLSSVGPTTKCSFDLRASALFIIELVMRNEPDMPRISKMCDARGAVRYSSCTTIRIRLRDEGGGGGRRGEEGPSKQFKLSKQESRDFLEFLERSIPDRGIDANFRDQLSEFYLRLVENRSRASSQSSMDASDA